MEILNKLQGGDLRSIGRADEVVNDILADNALFDAVFDGMCNPDPVIRMRAADAVEKVTRINPVWLFPFKKQLIEEVSQIEQQEVQWHLAQMFSRLDLEDGEVDRVVRLLRGWIERSKSNIVKVNSIQCLCDMAFRYANLKPLVIQILQLSMVNGSPAVVSRIKKLLPKFGVEDAKR
jgi:hypothetical protein